MGYSPWGLKESDTTELLNFRFQTLVNGITHIPEGCELKQESAPTFSLEAGESFLLLLLSRISRVRLPATPRTVAHQAPPSMGFSRQEYWSGVPLPSPGDLSYPGIEPSSPRLEAHALTSEPPAQIE